MIISSVMLASGNSRRFGQNKLFCEINGESLIKRAIKITPEDIIKNTVLVTQYNKVVKIAKEYGIKTIINPMLSDNISESIKLGILGIDQTSDGCLFRVCDQPFLEKDSIQRVIKHFYNSPCNIISLSFGLKRGNPVLFPKKYFTELANLSPGENGKTVIKNHIDDLILVNAKSYKEIIDIDTVADYNANL